MTHHYRNPAAGITDPHIAAVVVALLDPTVPRPVRGTLVDALDTRLRAGDPRTMKLVSFVLTVAIRALPATDPWRLGGYVGDPYEGLATDTLLHWGEVELEALVRRWDGLPPDAHRLLFGTGTVARIDRSLKWTEPTARVLAFGDALAAVWRRLTSYGVPLSQFAMLLSDVDDAGPKSLQTRSADTRATIIRPPAGLVPVVTCFPSLLDPSPDAVADIDLDEPPF